MTRTHVLKPLACRCCGKALHGEDPEPYRHQVVEIPKVVADVDEYQFHTLTCDDCGTSTRASLPAGVPTGQFGPRMQAIVALSSGAYKMSKRDIEQMVEDFFGVPISLGSIANLEQATSEAIAAPVAEVAQAIQQQLRAPTKFSRRSKAFQPMRGVPSSNASSGSSGRRQASRRGGYARRTIRSLDCSPTSPNLPTRSTGSLSRRATRGAMFSMATRTLLDTDIWSEILKAKDPTVAERARTYHAELARARARDVLAILRVRGISVPDAARDHILAEKDPRTARAMA